jgi:hypothetical protein
MFASTPPILPHHEFGQVAHVRVCGTIEREKAEIGVLICLEKPTKPMARVPHPTWVWLGGARRCPTSALRWQMWVFAKPLSSHPRRTPHQPEPHGAIDGSPALQRWEHDALNIR